MPQSLAQLYGVFHRPTDVEYRHFRSPHFRLIYQTGLEAEALEMSSILERSLPEVRALVGLRREIHVPVILNRFSDRSNGYVAALPFRQEIESTNLRVNILSPRFESWFEVVAPHELVHAAHAESGEGFGMGWILRKIGPDLARTLNLTGPRGVSEGAAVYYESSFRPGAGRLNHSIFMMEFRAAMLSDRPPNLTQMLEPPSYTRPFDRYYHGGAHLFAYMAERDGLDFFPRARNFYYRFPFFGYGPALWYGTRIFPHTLGRRLQRHYREAGREFVESLGELTDVQVIASKRGAAFRRPRWIDNETLLVYARGYDRRPGFYRVHVPTGESVLVANQGITEDIFYSLTPDRKNVLFARYVPDTFEPIRSSAEAFRLDVQTGNVSRLTRRGRVHAPVESADGTVWVLRNEPLFNVLSELTSAGEVVPRQASDRTYFLSAEPSPRGDTMAVLANRNGHQGIFRMGNGALRPWIVFPDASIYDMSWSSEGRYLLFTADPGKVTNIYAWDALGDRILKLTNVPFGAFEPGLSPDGTTLAFISYRHERFELVQIPFLPDNASEIHLEAVDFVTEVEPNSPSVPVTTEHEKYIPLLNVRPRVAYPFFVYQQSTDDEKNTSLGFGGGAGIEWSDPLQYWTAQTAAYYQKDLLWGRFFLQSGRTFLHPGIELFRNPSTVVVRIRSGESIDTVRVGREDRGVAVGIRLPAVLKSNVFQSSAQVSVAALYRQERLFDDAGRTLRSWENRLAMTPAATLVLGSQSNARDIIPNSGVLLSIVSEVDVWSDRVNPSNWLQARSTVFLPFLRRSNTGLALTAALLAQNRGGIVDLTTFFPRGYESEGDFLGRGVFARYGAEVIQPVWYIDNGFFLFPLYFKALFLYGFAETLQQVSGPTATDRLAVAGAGLGLQMRLAHSISFTIRFAPVYDFVSDEWDVTFR